jgi:thiosulfate/3-mercaptopyruvate sulfurtransferase
MGMTLVTTLRRIGLAAIASWGLFASPLLAADGSSGNLVTAAWLHAHAGDPRVLILDTSAGAAYAAGHVPGAVGVDVFSWYGVKDEPRPVVEKRLQAWGVSPGKTIVMYDQGGTFLATRLFYALLYYGVPQRDLRILDGGMAKWRELGMPVSTNPTPAPARGSWKIGNTREDVRVELPEFLEASGDPVRNALVNALGADWHYGQVVALSRAGHVPHAVLLPSADFFNPDKTFKAAAEIRKMLDFVGVRPTQRIYTHCGGGMAASVPFFALKALVGYPQVKLFTASEMGWLSDDRELPFWTYDVPSLLRNARWLQFWGGQMLRAVVGSTVSVVDVRPAAAFAQGHIPFAVNIPADVFRANVTSPATLAGILRQSGVDPSHEAVLVSGAGLTPDAALAFVLLETVGQRKVSVLVDSLSAWSQQGFPTTASPTVVGTQAGPRELAVAPVAARSAPRPGVIVQDAASSGGIYPRVFVTSGTANLSTPPSGRVVHLSSAELVADDGRPLAAKDIWSALTKAGVPRYTELVCVADDPAQAALTYVVLRLMGFPDIKVLAAPAPSA